MAVNIEDAEFTIRDVICWHYGQGFPKSLDISKAIDQQAGASRDIIGTSSGPNAARYTSERYKEKRQTKFGVVQDQQDKTAPQTADAKKWEGWGTALKPATEFWTLARKPLSEKTVAANVLKYGTGRLNIDGSRIGDEERTYDLKTGENLNKRSREGGNDSDEAKGLGAYGTGAKQVSNGDKTVVGRFPANMILDERMAAELDAQSGLLTSGKPVGIKKATKKVYGQYGPGMPVTGYGDSGGASRLFYVAKADPEDRGHENDHPTVKPTALIHYLLKMICPIEPERIVLEPFAGSGTTCLVARKLGIHFIAFEKDPAIAGMAEKRLKKELGLFK